MRGTPSPSTSEATIPDVVSLRTPVDAGSRADLDELHTQAAQAAGDVEAALELACRWGSRLPHPGGGNTLELWESLATVASVDLQVARVLEPHVDALAILGELDGRTAPPGTTWGVFAAEGPGMRLEARPAPSEWELTGVKPWCSMAGQLSHALVTAWRGDERGLFAIDLTGPGITTDASGWVARGLPDVVSTPITLDTVKATEVGGAGWYLRRNGFAWGGMGVAAVWFGGAVAVARRLARQASDRELDQVGLVHLGAVDRAIHVARTVLAAAARDIDAGEADGEAGAALAHRVRGTVVAVAEEVLRRADHALGPAPLVAEADHAGAVADLHLYIRQHHAERDDAALGRMLAAGSGRSW